MKTYVGRRNRAGDAYVVIEDGPAALARALPPRRDLVRHSPDGFEWGYLGSGPAQLALALLADLTDSEKAAVAFHLPFCEEVIARLPSDGWQINAETAARWCLAYAKRVAAMLGDFDVGAEVGLLAIGAGAG